MLSGLGWPTAAGGARRTTIQVARRACGRGLSQSEASSTVGVAHNGRKHSGAATPKGYASGATAPQPCGWAAPHGLGWHHGPVRYDQG